MKNVTHKALFLGLAIGGGLPLSARAADPASAAEEVTAETPEPTPRPVARVRLGIDGPRIMAPGAKTDPDGFVIEGVVGLVDDGVVHISEPVPSWLRRRLSRARRVPLSQIPAFSDRAVYFGSSYEGPPPGRMVKKRVQARLRVNERGFVELIDLVPVDD